MKSVVWAELRRVRWPMLLRFAAALLFGVNLFDGNLVPMYPTAAVLLLGLALQIEKRSILRAAPVTLSLAAFVLAVYGITVAVLGLDGARAFASSIGVGRQNGLLGNSWRVLASACVHFNWEHVRSNAYGLLAFGFLLEPRIGSRRMFQALLVSNLTGCLATAIFSSRASGLSSALYGLPGVMLTLPFWETARRSRSIGWTWVFAVVFSVTDIPFIQFDPTNAFAAHYAGFVGGMSLGLGWAVAGARTANWRARWGYGAAAAALVLAFVGVAVINPRWPAERAAHEASEAERNDDLEEAQKHWREVADLADPSSLSDAEWLHYAAKFWYRHPDLRNAVPIMAEIAPTLGAEGYNQLAAFQSNLYPFDERAALESWRESLALAPADPEVLAEMASRHLYTKDRLLNSPERARALAWCAAEADGFQSPEILRLLAQADQGCGRYEGAVHWMSVAISRSPGDLPLYETELKEMITSIPPGSARRYRLTTTRRVPATIPSTSMRVK